MSVLKKQVVMLVRQFHKLGGLEKYSMHTANALIDKGYDVHVLTTGKRSASNLDKGIKFHYFDLGRGANFSRIKRFDENCQDWLKNNPFPVVLGMDITSFQTHIRAGNGSHAAYLKRRCSFEPLHKRLSFKINPLHRKILSLEKKAFEHPQLKKLITNSNMVREEILTHYQTSPEKTGSHIQWC